MKTSGVITFQCGHAYEVKPNCFGRGKARLARLAQYANRNCLSCARVKAVELVNSLTDTQGKPLPETIRAEKIQARFAQLIISHNMTYES